MQIHETLVSLRQLAEFCLSAAQLDGEVSVWLAIYTASLSTCAAWAPGHCFRLLLSPLTSSCFNTSLVLL